jgi:hypothetical protein
MRIDPSHYMHDHRIAVYADAVLRRARIAVDECSAIWGETAWRGGWHIETINQPPRPNADHSDVVRTVRYMPEWVFSTPKTERKS